jgi:hypothetical protein
VVKTVHRKLKTIVGKIEFKYKVLTDGKEVISPLFDFLGLKKRQRVSEELKSCAEGLVVDQSYRKSCEILSNVKGVKISHSSLWKWVQEGDKIEEKEIEWFNGNEKEVFCEVDGMYVRIREAKKKVPIQIGMICSQS